MTMLSMEEFETDPEVIAAREESARESERIRIQGIIDGEIEAALAVTEGELATRRQMAREYYDSKPYGLEVDGRSTVVTSEVADTINWAIPGLMRTFFGGPEFGRYIPTKKGQEKFSGIASKVVNHWFMHRCNGYTVAMWAMKNALLEQNGPMRVTTEVVNEVCYYSAQQKSIEQVTELISRPGIELVAAEPSGEPMQVIDGITGQPRLLALWNIEYKETIKRAKMVVRAIPPENFMCTPRAEFVDDEIPFVCERYLETKSKLIALGFDKDAVMALPVAEEDADAIANDRHSSTDPALSSAQRDDEMARVWIYDGFVRIDEDGDGIAELRHFIKAGRTGGDVLLDEYANYPEFTDLTPIPRPHTIHGDSYFMLVADLQLIVSMLLRNLLDNVYTLNNGRWEVVEKNLIDPDDMLSNEIGGMVRVKEAKSVTRLDAPSLGTVPLDVISFLDSRREMRTGMSRASQGLDASALRNTTATATQELQNAARAQLELIARTFAETGFKRLFQLMLREFVYGPYQADSIYLNEEWVDFDPQTWNAEMDVEIVVGVGVGEATQRLANLDRIFALQEKLQSLGFGGYMVTPKDVFAALREAVAAMGFKTNLFFTDPGDKPPPPPPPNPLLIDSEAKMLKAQSDLKADMARIALEAQKVEAEVKIKSAEQITRQRELDIRLQVDMARIASQEKIEMMKLAAAKTQAKSRSKGEGAPASG